jgi:hypothetical protein
MFDIVIYLCYYLYTMQLAIETIDQFNRHISDASERGDHIALVVVLQPSHRIVSMDPVRLTRYGRLRNKAPLLEGQVTLVGLLSEDPRTQLTDDNTARVYVAMEADDGTMYASTDDAMVQNALSTVVLSQPSGDFASMC